MAKKKKIIRYRKPFHINIGVIIFAVVFIYFTVYLISYATEKHISVYEVQKGQIAQKNIYSGLALRSEEVVYANSTGAVNYYVKEGDKAGQNDLICSIDKDGGIAEQISQAGLDGSQLDSDSLTALENSIKTYVNNCSDMSFYNVYSFKTTVDAQVQEALYVNALNALSDQTDEAVKNQTFQFQSSPRDGVVALYTDGYEDITIDTFENRMFDASSYSKNNLNSNQTISEGQALFKLITNEDWYVLVPIDEVMAKNLAEKDYVTITFRKDGTKATPAAEIRQYGEQNYLVLKFNSSMVRFISDRYVELELGTDSNKGLKIPNSSIIEKEFLVIPKKYFTNGGDDSDPGVLKVSDKKGSSSVEFIATDLYYETETAYYVDENDLAAGDVIQAAESSEQYTLDKTATLKGVYNINKGYAVFKQIDIMTQNEEYAILKTGTSYGLSLYDHIALNGSEIKEGELIH